MEEAELWALAEEVERCALGVTEKAWPWAVAEGDWLQTVVEEAVL